jgi:hypothetical protein
MPRLHRLASALTLAFTCAGWAAQPALPTSRPAADLIPSATARLQLPGEFGTIVYPSAVEPLDAFEIVREGGSGPLGLIFAGRHSQLAPGKPVSLMLSGPEGLREFEIDSNGKVVASGRILLQSRTRFEAGKFTPIFDMMRTTVKRDRSIRTRRGKIIHVNHHWFRDNVHEMKGYKFWEQDLSSFLDTLLELQHPDGFFYEILATPKSDYDHLSFVDPKHRLEEPADNLGWVRLEIEADIEYMTVEGAYTIWQATGDDAAMRARLPHLEKALLYDFTDPTRWDAEHGALKRTFTIDTWDFTYGQDPNNRRIQPGMPMCIMHGDNSGLYAACRQLATMLHAAGQAEKAAEWDSRAAALRERINRLCWNGKFYTHQIHLTPVDTGVDEKEILSLSNTYDINRGLPTHEMAVKIIDEYQARRKARAATHFAEWFSIDPPYPQFGRRGPGKYINGGIAGFVGAELAKAALNEGREAYGADILNRLADKVAADGAMYFLYTPEGKNQGGGPNGWGAAALISALMEGLAGVRDDAVCYGRVTIAPRLLAAGIDHARVCARYGPSGAYVAMNYDHDPAAKTIRLQLAGVADEARVRILLPDGVRTARMTSPADVAGAVSRIEQSHYLEAELSKGLTDGVCEVVVAYE